MREWSKSHFNLYFFFFDNQKFIFVFENLRKWRKKNKILISFSQKDLNP